MEKHTAGPWKDGPVFKQEGRAIFWTDESKPGKWQHRLDADKSGVFSETDARLIAAAPELLAALSKILYAHDTKNCGASMGEAILCPAYADEARDAIAKATS